MNNAGTSLPRQIFEKLDNKQHYAIISSSMASYTFFSEELRIIFFINTRIDDVQVPFTTHCELPK